MNIDPKKAVFVFPGQGSQSVGMGRALSESFVEAKKIFEGTDEILGVPLSRIMWEGPESALNDTLNTQPALFVHSLAAHVVIRARHPALQPAFLAGHSLGQLSALAASGAISFEDGLRLVRKRGELMKRAGQLNPGSMAAILGLDIPTLEGVCAAASTPQEIVQVANDNCPGQVVISGHRLALERAMAGAKSAGAKRALPLAVSIAAHSPLMDSIQSEWDEAVSQLACRDAAIPVVGNVHAQPITAADALRADIKAQMQSRVRWTESVRWLAGQGVLTFVELGAGSVLGGLVKRIAPEAQNLAIGAPDDFAALG